MLRHSYATHLLELAPISARSSCRSDTPSWPPRRSICTCPAGICRPCPVRLSRLRSRLGRGEAFEEACEVMSLPTLEMATSSAFPAAAILSVVDAYTRECLALEADTSLGNGRVTRVLEQVIAERGMPENVRSDNGPEFTSRCMIGGRRLEGPAGTYPAGPPDARTGTPRASTAGCGTSASTQPGSKR